MNLTNESGILQGRVQFPTGGKSPRPSGILKREVLKDAKG